jgi:ABC-type sugar transport system substrate-binding protein
LLLPAAPKPGGKIIMLVNGKIASDVQNAERLKPAVAAISWTSQTITYDGTVEDLNAKFDQAIAAKPTMITLSGQEPELYQGPLAAAKKAGIVVSVGAINAMPTNFPGFAAVSGGASEYDVIGRIHANMVMRDSGCKAHVAIFGLPLPILKDGASAFEKYLKQGCPDCMVKYEELQPADIGTPAATDKIISTLQADPSIKYAYTVIANLASGLPAALNAAGINGIKIFGQVPDPNAIKELQDGRNAWWINIGSDTSDWRQLYAGLIAIETRKPVKLTGLPLSVLTPDNIDKSITDVPDYPTDWQADFKKLWHVG